jgi:hypothetical protein
LPGFEIQAYLDAYCSPFRQLFVTDEQPAFREDTIFDFYVSLTESPSAEAYESEGIVGTVETALVREGLVGPPVSLLRPAEVGEAIDDRAWEVGLGSSSRNPRSRNPRSLRAKWPQIDERELKNYVHTPPRCVEW